MHGFEVACILDPGLLQEAIRLVFGVVQLGESVGDFTATDKQLKAVSNHWIFIIAA